MIHINIEFYTTADGKEVVADFLDSLYRQNSKLHAKSLREFDLLASCGTELREPHVKHIEGEIWELRVKFSTDITRLFYFVWQNDTAVILHGFVKKTQKTPRAEITIANKRLADYKKRHR